MRVPEPGENGPSGEGSGTEEPPLEIEEIQGNILAGFNKDHQVLMGLRIRGIDAARTWLARIEPEIASTAEVLRFNDLFRALRARRGKDPQGLVATWANIAFSYEGLRKLTSEAELAGFPDDEEAFKNGLPARSATLHDPTDENEEGHPSHWVVGGPGNVPDILLIIASDDPGQLAAAVQRLRPQPASPDATGGGDPPEVIYEEQGATRPDLPGHEHFGFKDGISQPGVRGLIRRSPDLFLTPRLLDPSDPAAGEFGRPGQPLIWPGHFVFGYPSQSLIDGTVLEAPEFSPAWVRNGSFLVFRRLRQDVQAFREFLQAEAAALAREPGFEGMTTALLGAMLVGRWASGAPIMRAPDHDDPELAANSAANNHFIYEEATPPVRLRSGAGGDEDRFPAAQGDPLGLVCPHFAHVQKANPRDMVTDLGDAFDTLTRRILRRGIPFGSPLPCPAPPNDDGNRGLHFLSYQTSIPRQFETPVQAWSDSENQPRGGGPDPIIGQHITPAGERRRTLVFLPRSTPVPAGGENGGDDISPPTGEPPSGGSPATRTLPREWVIPTGGGYFFAPSLSAIREHLARSTGATS